MRDSGKKKILMIFAGVIVLAILIIIVLLIYNAIFGKNSYEDVENKVVTAAEKYYNEHSELLPKNENEQVKTTDTALTEAGYLDSMSKLTKGLDSTCTAEVIVSYANGEYRYTPLLNCGDDYKTVTLSSYIKENETVVTTGEGLYKLNKELVYRGEEPNNYVKFADKSWRIVKIVDDEVVLILNEKVARNVWDDRFNSDRNNSDGINNYSVSRIKESLEDLYDGEALFEGNTKNLLASHNLYVGSRNIDDTKNDGSIEKSKVLKNQYIGLLPLYDYINASIDKNCVSASTDSCTNYNYLNKFDYSWWTLTSDAATTHKVFRISNSGTIDLLRAGSNGYVRPVIHLASDALYASGDGTLENPYKIK